MTKEEIINRIYGLYSGGYQDIDLFKSALETLARKQNEYVENAFIIANLRLAQSSKFSEEDPIVANLLCYIAVETLTNTIAYFKVTKGIKHKDFQINCQIEKRIKKTEEFINFLSSFSPPALQQRIVFKKYLGEKTIPGSFREFLRYLYVRNRCLVVHKGLSRTLESNERFLDAFIDEKGTYYSVDVGIRNKNLTLWLIEAVEGSFKEFLSQNVQ